MVPKSVNMVPIVHTKSAKNPIFFPAILIALQVVFIALLAIHSDYGHEPEAKHDVPARLIAAFPNGTYVFRAENEGTPHRGIADFYSMFQDIHVMIFIGFGFLMTFLKRYG